MIEFNQITAKEAPEPKRRRYVKNGSCLVIVDADGKFVDAIGTLRVDVQVLHKGRKRPTQLRDSNDLLARFSPSLVEGKDFVHKKKPIRKKARKYVDLQGWDLKRLGIEAVLHFDHGHPHHRLKFPDNILESHRKYNEAQQILMAELLLQGAVWCEWNGRHFLAVL